MPDGIGWQIPTAHEAVTRMAKLSLEQCGSRAPARDGVGPLTCEFGDIHVWMHRSSRELRRHRIGAAPLDAEEYDRASRIRSVGLRAQFVESHLALRCVLSRYLSLAPRQIRFMRGVYGKPYLAGDDPTRDEKLANLRFNMSHSGPLTLVAVARSMDVGIDVEQTQLLEDWHALAERVCSHSEREALRAQRDRDVDAAFNRLWVRKEAYIKGIGPGSLRYVVGHHPPASRYAVGIGIQERTQPRVAHGRLELLECPRPTCSCRLRCRGGNAAERSSNLDASPAISLRPRDTRPIEFGNACSRQLRGVRDKRRRCGIARMSLSSRSLARGRFCATARRK